MRTLTQTVFPFKVESTEDMLIWYRQRGEVSGNGIKELKIGPSASSGQALAWSACPAGSLPRTPFSSASVSSPTTCLPCSSARHWVKAGRGNVTLSEGETD